MLAACLYKGAAAGDGKIPHCGRRYADHHGRPRLRRAQHHLLGYFERTMSRCSSPLPDWAAAEGMRMLAAPIKGDAPITSGESGAAPFGALAALMTREEYADLRARHRSG